MARVATFRFELISFVPKNPEDLTTSDLDGDGDPDILVASKSGSDVTWLANDGAGSFADAQSLTDTTSGPVSVAAADLDGDGDNDIVWSGDIGHELAWQENLGNGDFSDPNFIDRRAVGLGVGTFIGGNYGGVQLGDFDGDGDMDLVSSMRGDDQVAWYENDGEGNFSGAHQLIETFAGTTSVEGADLDGDGDNDVVATTENDDQVTWYENVDGLGTLGPQKIISRDSWGVQEAIPADVDGDGDIDIVVASEEDDTVAWFANDSSGNFGPRQILDAELTSVFDIEVQDFDGDGDLDVVALGQNKLAWFENDGSSTLFAPLAMIATLVEGYGQGFELDDVDGDSDIDVVYFNSLGVRRLMNDNMSFGSPIVVVDRTFVSDIVLADTNNDSFVDILVSARGDEVLEQFRYSPDDGEFVLFNSIAEGPAKMVVADIDGDGSVDLMTDNHWYPNRDSMGTFATELRVFWPASYPTALSLADLTGDGNLDVITARRFGAELVWQPYDGPCCPDVDIEDIDFDDDGDVDVDDVDLLTENIVVGPADPTVFDLNDDNAVDGEDLWEWLSLAGEVNLPSRSPYLSGDANLDGAVDISDFNAWNEHKFTVDHRWSSGNFNLDEFIDVGDFGIWNSNKFTSSFLRGDEVWDDGHDESEVRPMLIDRVFAVDASVVTG